MATKIPQSSKDIIALLSRLKVQTPEYPADLLAARKAAFIRHAVALGIQGKGQGGGHEGSSSSGGSGPAMGGPTSAQGFFLQSLIGLGLVATVIIGMLTGDYLLHDQVSGPGAGESVAFGESSEATILPVTGASPMPTAYEILMATPEITVSVTESAIESDTIGDNEIDDLLFFNELSKGKKDNPGLHLGQATGTPAAPGQGNPGNINQPDKPDKPDKPEKPENPNKTDKGR